MSHNKAHARAALSRNGTKVTDSDGSLTLDERFSLLANSRRRHAIEIIFEHERIDFGELVDRVAELEYGLPIEEISSDERHTIYVSLQQTHTERLEEDGIISRDRDTGTIGLGHNADELADMLAKLDGDDSIGRKLKRSLSSLC